MKKTLVPLVLVAVLAGCIPSVHPFYTEKDVVFDQRLLGEWQVKDEAADPQLWKFEAGEEKSYKLVLTEKTGKQGEFKAHLFKLKENYFLDIVPTECRFDTNQADMISFCLVAGHLVLRVPQLEPNLKLAFFDFDWLEKLLEKNPKALAHHTEEKRIVLTADTPELQAFVLKHLAENELFQEPKELARKGASPKATQPANK